MRAITSTLLLYRADVAARGFAIPPSGGEASGREGLTLEELADGDRDLCHLLRATASNLPGEATLALPASILI